MTIVIAEIGVNWDGDFELVKEMMEKSKSAGCDAVKFQAFNKETIGNHPLSMRLLKSSISPVNIEKIDNLAREIGIEWFCTPMYTEAVDFLNRYVSRFKIREIDGRSLLKNESTELFEKIIKTGKEVFVSAFQSPKMCKFYDNKQVKWLYCVPKYPCSMEDLDFSKLGDFDGYSNHCPQIIAPLTAANLGAKIIEIHITSDTNKDFIDNIVSFDYFSLGELVKQIKMSEKIQK